jgi:exodeoxyribonuclease VII large subunit
VARARWVLGRRRDALAAADRKLAAMHPRAILARERAQIDAVGHRLQAVWSRSFARRAAELQRTSARLDAYSPLKVLARGYAIATRDDGRAVRSGDDVAPGDALHVRVRDARVEARVEKVEPLDPLEARAGATGEATAKGPMGGA